MSTELELAPMSQEQMREFAFHLQRTGCVQQSCRGCGQLLRLWSRRDEETFRCEPCGGQYMLEIPDA